VTDDLKARFFIDLQPEHVRTRVVPCHVQVELPFGNLAGVEISCKDLFIRIIWLRQQATERIDDHAAATHQYGLRIVSLDRRLFRGIIAATNILAGREYETPAFERDVPNGRDPGLAVVGRWGAVNLDALGIHGCAQQRHVIFPTDDSPHFATGCIENW
jgi:hypothetical protein